MRCFGQLRAQRLISSECVAHRKVSGTKILGPWRGYVGGAELQLVGNTRLLHANASLNPRWLLVVDARYVGKMTEEETAHVLSVSPRTVRRDWSEARTWLAGQLGIASG